MAAPGILEGTVVGASGANPLIGLATGVLGSLFGKSKKTGGLSGEQKWTYNTRRGIYNSTNFEKLVQDAIKNRKNINQDEAMRTLENYDAVQAGKGSPIFSADSRKDSSRALIASNAGRDTAAYASDLLFRSPWLKQSLVPDLQGGPGVPEQMTNNSQALMSIAPLLEEWLSSVFR